MSSLGASYGYLKVVHNQNQKKKLKEEKSRSKEDGQEIEKDIKNKKDKKIHPISIVGSQVQPQTNV